MILVIHKVLPIHTLHTLHPGILASRHPYPLTNNALIICIAIFGFSFSLRVE